MSEKFCHFCGAQIDANAVVCPNCGKALGKTKFCRHCGAQIDADVIICPNCGKQVEELKTQNQQAAQPQIVINNANANTNTNTNTAGSAAYPYKSKTTALILCLLVGWLGIHRFYVGKTGTGLIWMFTFGLFGVGVAVDFILILLGSFRDKAGMPLQ